MVKIKFNSEDKETIKKIHDYLLKAKVVKYLDPVTQKASNYRMIIGYEVYPGLCSFIQFNHHINGSLEFLEQLYRAYVEYGGIKPKDVFWFPVDDTILETRKKFINYVLENYCHDKRH